MAILTEEASLHQCRHRQAVAANMTQATLHYFKLLLPQIMHVFFLSQINYTRKWGSKNTVIIYNCFNRGLTILTIHNILFMPIFLNKAVGCNKCSSKMFLYIPDKQRCPKHRRVLGCRGISYTMLQVQLANAESLLYQFCVTLQHFYGHICTSTDVKHM